MANYCKVNKDINEEGGVYWLSVNSDTAFGQKGVFLQKLYLARLFRQALGRYHSSGYNWTVFYLISSTF